MNLICRAVVHRGQILESYIRKRGFALTKLGELMPWTVKTIYRHFEDPDLPFDRIIQYSRVLKYDFRAEFPGLKEYEWMLTEPEQEYEVKPGTGDDAGQFYRKKYEDLLEKYNDMLVRYNLLLEKHATN